MGTAHLLLLFESRKGEKHVEQTETEHCNAVLEHHVATDEPRMDGKGGDDPEVANRAEVAEASTCGPKHVEPEGEAS